MATATIELKDFRQYRQMSLVEANNEINYINHHDRRIPDYHLRKYILTEVIRLRSAEFRMALDAQTKADALRNIDTAIEARLAQ